MIFSFSLLLLIIFIDFSPILGKHFAHAYRLSTTATILQFQCQKLGTDILGLSYRSDHNIDQSLFLIIYTQLNWYSPVRQLFFCSKLLIVVIILFNIKRLILIGTSDEFLNLLEFKV